MGGKFLIEEKMNEKLSHIITTILTSFLVVLGNISLFAIMLVITVVTDVVYCLATSIKKNGLKGFNYDKLLDSGINLVLYLMVVLIMGIVDYTILENNPLKIEFIATKVVTLIFLSIELKHIEKTHLQAGGKRFKVYFSQLVKFFNFVKKSIKDENN